MEVVYLLFSIASSAITSALLSLRLALRCLLAPSTDAAAPPADEHSSPPPPPLWLYEGHVKHVRRSPRHHAFEYPVRYALVDLDRASAAPPSALPTLVLPPSFFAGHLSPDEARAAAGTTGPVLLLTIPPSVGYEQNPLSVYYCYDAGGVVPAATQEPASGSDADERSATTPIRLKKCIAEVTNTPWGERVSFVFDPTSDLVAKPLHVSPFMALKLWWRNVSFIQHPRYSNPTYREDALLRNEQLRCPLAKERTGNADHHSDSGSLLGSTDRRSNGRWCVWRNAEWPWS